MTLMKKQAPAASPDAYVQSLTGWRKTLVQGLRKATLTGGKLEEQIKWGHLVYFSGGPVLLIRAEVERVLFGFWRGKRLRELDERLKASGKYEMATITLVEGDKISAAQVKRLVKAAIDLNHQLGDPTSVAKRGATAAKPAQRPPKPTHGIITDEFRALALDIPGAVEQSHMQHPDFRLNGKIFASLGAPSDEWGMVKLTPTQQEKFVKRAPKMFKPCNGAWGRQGYTIVHLESANTPVLRLAIAAAAQHVAASKSKRKKA
jgi:hypothetical protein